MLGLRRYPEIFEEMRLYASRFADDPDSYRSRASLESHLQHGPAPLRALLRERGALFEPEHRRVIEAQLARAEGRYLDAVHLWEGIPTTSPADYDLRIGFLYFAGGDTRAAAQAFGRAERAALAQSMLGDHAEADRVRRVPFGGDPDMTGDPPPVFLLLKDDARYDALINHPPRLCAGVLRGAVDGRACVAARRASGELAGAEVLRHVIQLEVKPPFHALGCRLLAP